MSNRILICTFTALTTGCFGFWAGGKINLAVQRRACEAQPFGFSTVCKTLVTPSALWKGSTTGCWTGAILGAFVAGSLTRKPDQVVEPSKQPGGNQQAGLNMASLRSSHQGLTPAQTETLSCLLALVAAQPDDNSEEPSQVVSTTAGTVQPSHIAKPLSLEEAHQLLQQMGFSQASIEQAWRMFQAIQAEKE